MAAAAMLNFKISIFGHVTVFRLKICYSVPNFIKIGRFFTEIWRFKNHSVNGSSDSVNGDLQFLWE